MAERLASLVHAEHGTLPSGLRQQVLNWVYTLFAHNMNETQTILRAATALGYGLDPSKYVSTFPGSSVNVVVQAPDVIASKKEATVTPEEQRPSRPPDPCATGVAANPSPASASTPAPSQSAPVVVTPGPSPGNPPMATVPRRLPLWVKLLGVLGLIAAGAGIGWGVGTLIRSPSTPATPPTTSAPLLQPQEWQLKIIEEKKP